MKPTADFLAQAQSSIEEVCRRYRPILVKAHGNIEHEIKGDDTPVTKLDLEIEHELKEALRKLDANIGFEGEEHGKEGNEETFWLIDPIDGTEGFIRGLPIFRNMLTLIDNDEPVFALVYSVVSDELFIAKKGQGTTRNGSPVKLSERPIKRALIEATGNSALPEVMSVFGAVRAATRGIRMTGEFTYTLNGYFDGHLFYKASGSYWDYPPWALLIQEAGGRVANIGSDKYHYRNGDFLASNSAIFDELAKVISDVAARGDPR